ncbi:MAG: hypothetical protein R3332_03630 [Pseudohongiellaceae bacterium]|nr:hypothetical protein [Pseudohongiellaceae bacterium]
MKARFFASLLLLIATTAAHADSDASLTWALSEVSYGGTQANYLALDINFGTRYIAINGIIELEGNTAVNVTGSCFPSGSGVFCNASIGNNTASLTISENLTGIFRMFSPDGSLSSQGAMAPL